MTLVEQLLSQTRNGRQELLRQELIVSATEQIWAAMEAAGMNKAEVARALDTSKANVTQLLNGQRNMTLSTLADLCAAVDARPQITITSNRMDAQASLRHAEPASVGTLFVDPVGPGAKTSAQITNLPKAGTTLSGSALFFAA